MRKGPTQVELMDKRIRWGWNYVVVFRNRFAMLTLPLCSMAKIAYGYSSLATS
jgi:hypothetical protein